MGSTHYRSVCSGHCKRLQTTFQMPSTSILPSHNKPKIQQGVSSHKTGSEFSSLERCNKADSQVSSKICVPSVHCSQKVWRFKTCDKLETSKSISAFANIQDGRSLRLEGSLRAQRIYDHNRSVRRLYDSSYRGRVKKLSVFPISRSDVSILCPSIWSQRCSKTIYKNSETSSRNFKISRFQTSSVPRRHYSSCIYKGTLYLPRSDSDKNFRKPGFCYKSRKIKSGTFSSGPFSGLYCGLKENVLFTSRFKDSINQVECPDSVESTKGFITKTKPVHWNVQCFKNCSPRSTTSLQINPKSVDKHSEISAHHTTELRYENMSEQSVKKRFDLVGQKFENQLFKINPPSTSGSFNYVRCLRSSLGSSPRICKNSGFLKKLSVFLAHKQKGVKSSLSGIKILNPKSNKCSCSNLHRQQNSGCLYKPFRGHKISGIEFHYSKNVGTVSREEHVPFSSVCTRDIEQNSRFVIPPETGINRMDVKSQNFQTNSKCLQNASSRHVRIRPKSPSSKVFLLDSGSTSCGNGRILSKLEQRSPLHVSSLQSDSKMSSENNRRQGNCSFNNTSLAVKTMVSDATESPIQQASSITTQSTNIETAMVSNHTSSVSEQEVSSSRLAFVRRSFKHQKFSERVCKILQASWKPGTEKQYQSAWKQFFSWCSQRSCDPFSCSLNIILDYLVDLFYKGLEYRTINSH